jgi:hypothetical protein
LRSARFKSIQNRLSPLWNPAAASTSAAVKYEAPRTVYPRRRQGADVTEAYTTTASKPRQVNTAAPAAAFLAGGLPSRRRE